jgi:hypothetical protein
MRSIRQSVQNGQSLCRLIQNASDLLVAAHADNRVKRLLVHVGATAVAVDQTPNSVRAELRLVAAVVVYLGVMVISTAESGPR